MADLLECLLQIKALGETPRRLRTLTAGTPRERWAHRPTPEAWAPVEVVAHLADTELVFGVRLRGILTVERPFLQPVEGQALAARAGYLGWSPELALERFARRRTETIELLDVCSADELERIGVHPRRGEMTVADLVATMLAHDIDHSAQIRQRLGLLVPPTSTPKGEPHE